MPAWGSRRELLRAVFTDCLDDIRVDRALSRRRQEVLDALKRCRSGNGARTFLVAVGKAAVPMTRWMLDEAGVAADRGVVAAPAREGWRDPPLEFVEAGHPVPDAGSLRAGEWALSLARDAREDDCVLFLISGGGSSLCEAPRAPLSLSEVRAYNRALVSCGADISAVNAVRRRLSRVKGGRLAAAAHPARQLTLYISDVPEGREADVASGPTMPAPEGEPIEKIISRYRLERGLPAAVEGLLRSKDGDDMPAAHNPCFSRAKWLCVSDNAGARKAAASSARARGWMVTVLPEEKEELDVVTSARRHLERVRAERTQETPVCLISGGELSSPVTGDGLGGRNQAFVLECARRIDGEDISVLSAGTDGVDGNSPAAGAVADGSTLERARSLGLDAGDFARRSDAHTFFDRLGDAVVTGATGNNVRDVRVLVAWP